MSPVECIQVLDLKNWTWSRVETKVATESQETSTQTLLAPCAGHSLVSFFLLAKLLCNKVDYSYTLYLLLFFVCFVDIMGQQTVVYWWSYKGPLRIYAR